MGSLNTLPVPSTFSVLFVNVSVVDGVVLPHTVDVSANNPFVPLVCTHLLPAGAEASAAAIASAELIHVGKVLAVVSRPIVLFTFAVNPAPSGISIVDAVKSNKPVGATPAAILARVGCNTCCTPLESIF